MALDLETMRRDIQTYLDDSGMAVFHGYAGMSDALNQVSWDTERRPDFKQFLAAARKAGAKIIVFYDEALSLDEIDDALERLEESDFSREEKRNLETRLRQLQAYEGFTCRIELSFSIDTRSYVFEVHTEWYDALNDILAELEAAEEEEQTSDGGGLGGYFSNN